MAVGNVRRLARQFGVSLETLVGLACLVGLGYWILSGPAPAAQTPSASNGLAVERRQAQTRPAATHPEVVPTVEAPGHKQPIARIEPVHEETAMAVAQSNSGEPAVATFFADMNCEGSSVSVKAEDMNMDCGMDEGNRCLDLCSTQVTLLGKPLEGIKSIKITGDRVLDLYQECNRHSYWSSIYALDGCVNIYTWPGTKGVGFSKENPLAIPTETHKPAKPHKYRCVYSAESSVYFAYQAQASLYSFEKSGQDPDSAWTRLITARENDDLAETFPTYSAKRHPFARRYGPINKADVITKWFASVDAPQDEVIVVVDPDNWFTGNIKKWVDKVKPGHAVAQSAFFAGATTQVTQLWKEFCQKNCDFKLDLSAVPYLMHRDDWRVVAPLWKMYSIMIKERMETNPGFERRYPSLQVGWCAEMYGYVFASAHAGVPHTIEPLLQLRDVGPRMRPEQTKEVPFIHMGRIWFPKEYGCKQWCHSSGHEFDAYGKQVWCKCNSTASDIIPWPPAPGMDWVSAKTLEFLHDSREKYGPIPPSKYRPDAYHGSYP